MNGPYETRKDAIEAVRHIIASPPGPAWTAGNRRLLLDTLAGAGVVLAAYDTQIMQWLADAGEPQTLAVIAGWVTRANHPTGTIVLNRERVETALLALIDAKWSRVHPATECAACNAIETETQGEQDACEQHQPDLERAERYDGMLRWLARAAGVPEAAELSVNQDRIRTGVDDERGTTA